MAYQWRVGRHTVCSWTRLTSCTERLPCHGRLRETSASTTRRPGPASRSWSPGGGLYSRISNWATTPCNARVSTRAGAQRGNRLCRTLPKTGQLRLASHRLFNTRCADFASNKTHVRQSRQSSALQAQALLVPARLRFELLRRAALRRQGNVREV